TWSVGKILTINNWNFATGHLVVGSDNNGLTNDQLAKITFAHFAPGAQISPSGVNGLIAGEVTPRIGDINQDGSLTSADLDALLVGLTNPATYHASHLELSDSDTAFLLNVNHDDAVDNADIQAEIALLLSPPSPAPVLGSGPSPVPEPAS